MAADKCSIPSKGQTWFYTTGLPSDVVVEVDNIIFHLHKFPLISKSNKLHDLIAEQQAKQTPVPSLLSSLLIKDNDDKSGNEGEDGEDEVPEQEQCHVSLRSFPGDSETFEMAAKFCYGVRIKLTAGNVLPLRCAGEVLEMTEEYSEDNLISNTERFFTLSVLENIKDSIKALKSCERLSPIPENLGIVQRCIDAISSKAALYDPTLWVEDLAHLTLDLFNPVISAMREKELNPEIIESCLIHYAKRCFPGITRSNRKLPSSSIASEAEQRKLLETIVSIFPPEKSSRSPAPTRYLFGLLRAANILSTSEACKYALERKIGVQLEQATLDDLLIPSYSYLNETLYDVDCVERILGHYLDIYEEREIEEERVDKSPENIRSAAIMIVGKLIDGYLSEIASDANLKPEKFYELAMSLPKQARLNDDGVYRAVDVYLKAHSWITEAEREKICGVMDCQKLTLEACTHAAENERLPLRAVVQVLFFEQIQLRHAIAGALIAAEAATVESCRPSVDGTGDDEEAEGRESEGVVVTTVAQEKSRTWQAVRENQVLRLDMDSMSTRVHELERECSTMRKVIEKIDKIGFPQNGKSWRRSFTLKLGCKFMTQVCDSHESTVVAEGRKGRHHSKQQ